MKLIKIDNDIYVNPDSVIAVTSGISYRNNAKGEPCTFIYFSGKGNRDAVFQPIEEVIKLLTQ